MKSKLFFIVLILSGLLNAVNESYGTYIPTTSTTATSTTTTTATSTTSSTTTATTTSATTSTTTTTCEGCEPCEECIDDECISCAALNKSCCNSTCCDPDTEFCCGSTCCGPCQGCNPNTGVCIDICTECQECIGGNCISCAALGKVCCSGTCCESCCDGVCCSTTTTTSDTTTTTSDTTTTTSDTTTTTSDTTSTTSTTITTTSGTCTSDTLGPWHHMSVGTEYDECGNTLTLTLEGVFCYYCNGIKVGNCPYNHGSNTIGYWKTSDNMRFYQTYHKSWDNTNDGSEDDEGTKYKYDSVIWRYDCINGQGPFKEGIEHPTIPGGDDGTGSAFEETYCPPI